jgi:hypothetical protein
MRRRDLLIAGLAASLTQAARAATTPAVLELFTSQGCSSCQPGIIALAWHVDYWNGLGWHDPYSSPTATQRQQRYAAALHDEVYTPALVVNGARMVVGSDSTGAQAAIHAAGGFAVPVTLRRDGATAIAEIGAAGQPVSALLASYDPRRATAIGAGENGGRQLIEYHIVRDTTPLGAWDGAARRIVLPAIEPGRGTVLLLQSDDLQIRGAAELPAA